ncbi:hypothetical protein Fmac_006090 [Flemingia macrophylla]|uniref:Thioredoxin domain-containing protein n=1 Tax=Flemingia macrophylla TaxID=520843 RepID=A0ABD1N9Q5_9FABA
MVHGIIDEIAREYAAKYKCFILITDTDMQIADDYDFKAVPVVIMFKKGQNRFFSWHHAKGVLCGCDW